MTKKDTTENIIYQKRDDGFAVCVKLDHITFQSLCILSQTYYKVKPDPNSKTNCYMISKFRDTFDKSHDDEDRACASAVYTSRNISQSIRILVDRNLIYWANKDFVRISPGIFENLKRYDKDLEISRVMAKQDV